MPYHKLLDCLEEDRLADKKFGSTRRGISPVYADKYMKKAFRMGDLLHMDTLKKRLADVLEWKNLTVEGGYKNAPVQVEEMFAWLENTVHFLHPLYSASVTAHCSILHAITFYSFTGTFNLHR